MLRVAPALVAVAAAVAGCGGASHHDPAPPPEARAAVTTFLDALAKGRTDVACRLLAPDMRSDLRQTALGDFRVRPGSLASRRDQVRAARSRTATCAGALRLFADEHRAALPDATTRARTLRMSWFASQDSGVVILGTDEDWSVRRQDGAWRIASMNALPPEA